MSLEEAQLPPRLAELTTMRVGGRPERVLIAQNRDELVRLARELWASEEPWLLLGGGSNTIVSDEGYPGTVLLVRSRGGDQVVDHELAPGLVRLRVQAGQNWDQLVALAVSHGWAGIEALSGIPGSVGAAPVQNIGAYGAELSDVLHSIEFLDAHSDEPVRLSAAELELGYRDSAIKAGREGVVLSVDLVLRGQDAGSGSETDQTEALSAPIRYGQLAEALGVAVGDRVTLVSLRDAVLRLRASKGMVLEENDHDTWSAGSFFTNPVVSHEFASSLPTDVPRFPVGGESAHDTSPIVMPLDELAAGAEFPARAGVAPSRVKLSAAWLIEHAGVRRGFRLPGSGAAISAKHTLAITNTGSATAADIAELARYVIQRVHSEFGVLLVPEPNLYGLEL